VPPSPSRWTRRTAVARTRALRRSASQEARVSESALTVAEALILKVRRERLAAERAVRLFRKVVRGRARIFDADHLPHPQDTCATVQAAAQAQRHSSLQFGQ